MNRHTLGYNCRGAQRGGWDALGVGEGSAPCVLKYLLGDNVELRELRLLVRLYKYLELYGSVSEYLSAPVAVYAHHQT